MKHNKLNSLSNSEIISLVDQRVHNDRNRKILKDRFVNGFTFEYIANRYELSIPQVKNIVYKYETILCN